MNKWLVQEKYSGTPTTETHLDQQRIDQGEPLDYVIGTTPFLGCNIDVSHRPLIPRTETEYWVENALRTIPKHSPIKVLDLFAGSGCIGTAIAVYRPKAHIEFIDNDPVALQQIRKNIHIHNIEHRTSVLQSDVFSAIPYTTYNIIVANPPYLAYHTHQAHTSVVTWEPHTALFAPLDGLLYIYQTISQGYRHLQQGGRIYIEHDPEQTTRIHSYSARFPYTATQTHCDQYGAQRVTELKI